MARGGERDDSQENLPDLYYEIWDNDTGELIDVKPANSIRLGNLPAAARIIPVFKVDGEFIEAIKVQS